MYGYIPRPFDEGFDAQVRRYKRVHHAGGRVRYPVDVPELPGLEGTDYDLVTASKFKIESVETRRLQVP